MPSNNHTNSNYRLNANYYITKQIIPSLSRVFNLVGADIKSWYEEMPRTLRAIKSDMGTHPLVLDDVDIGGDGNNINNNNNARQQTTTSRQLKAAVVPGGQTNTIDHYYLNRRCAVCDKLTTNQSICRECLTEDKQATCFVITSRVKALERDYAELSSICLHCTGSTSASDVGCNSLDCDVFFARTKALRLLNNHESLKRIIDQF